MKKLINALDRIVGLAFFAVFIMIIVLAWRYGGPRGILTKKCVPLGAFLFVITMVVDIIVLSLYVSVLRQNSFKITYVLKPMLMLPIAIYNWLTAD